MLWKKNVELVVVEENEMVKMCVDVDDDEN